MLRSLAATERPPCNLKSETIAMLRFAEEIMLLLLDDQGGSFVPLSDRSVHYALAGAVLMDLALENRIDADLRQLYVVSAELTGDPTLDATLADIVAEPRTREPRYWVERVGERAAAIRAAALGRLVERGILKRQHGKFLWVFRARRYPVVDGQARQEAKLRILDVLLGDGVPDPRDVVLICLADACGIFGELLTKDELAQALPRFEQVRKLDLIGQAVTAAVADLDNAAEARVKFMIDQARPR